jgi:hypothetical protein
VSAHSHLIPAARPDLAETRKTPFRSRLGHLGWLAVGALCLSGCIQPCDPQVQGSQSYHVRILDTYRAGGMFKSSDRLPAPGGESSCNGIDGLGPGVSFDLAPAGTWDSDCTHLSGKVTTPLPAVTLGPAIGSAPGLIGGVHSVTLGGCSGDWTFAVRRVSGDVFATSSPGEEPHAVLVREFQPRDGGSCPTCNDYFVISLKPF